MRIQTTHVGSLPRPDEMVTRQAKKEAIDSADLHRYTSDIIKRQLAAGLSIVNTGEIHRSDYINATTTRLSGFGGTCTAPLPRDMEELPSYSRRFGGRNGLITLNPKAPISLPACTSAVRYTGASSLREELDSLITVHNEQKALYPESSVFFTAPSPGTVALFLENQYYPNQQSYLEALSEALAEEYKIIRSYGVYLQVDCPDLAMGRHTAYKEMSDDEYISLIETNIAVLNGALSEVDSELCRAHICWGNYPGTHHCDIGLEVIFDSIVKLKPRFLSIESCNHRHAHEWELFQTRSFPANKVLMPGVIDTTSNTVEHPDLVAKRLLDFASSLGPDRVVASTDCGFASTAAAASVSGEVAWLKLAALVAGAEKAGQKL
ncbi:MAG: cobalamin-independent methionine synthase II family protein [Spirochaetales bacterium]|nr:cobalamin-independent methionine synthase II family protein [Spirochaetales bacterium]